MEVHVIGIDPGRTVFHLVGLNPSGEVVVRKRFSRAQLLRFTGRDQNALKWSRRSIDFQRTANRVLTVCVSQGDNRIIVLEAGSFGLILRLNH
jgi:hypothetical protein